VAGREAREHLLFASQEALVFKRGGLSLKSTTLATRLDPSAVSVSVELATYERGGVTFSAKMTLGNTWELQRGQLLDKLTRDVHSGAILCL